MSAGGSSPHGRGTEVRHARLAATPRFIPAWAGNRMTCRSMRRVGAVHPRMGGEQGSSPEQDVLRIGSSPHGRGTGSPRRSGYCRGRFIPAWAGNRAGIMWRFSCLTVHPRMGGEQLRPSRKCRLTGGSSPHGRGTAPDPHDESRLFRFIPAWAGNSSDTQFSAAMRAVHPRMGGEQGMCGRLIGAAHGSSPHGRGTVACFQVEIAGLRFIPAWAGNSGPA